MEIHLRPALPEDHAFLHSLNRAAYEDLAVRLFGTWDDIVKRERLLDRLARCRYRIVEVSNERVGAVSSTESADHVLLHDLMLLPKVQRLGIGSYVLRLELANATDKQKPLRFHTSVKNEAQGLYRRLGFVEIGRDDHFIDFQSPVPAPSCIDPKIESSKSRSQMQSYYNQVSEKYARHRRHNAEVLAGLTSTSKITLQSQVLEIGCGSGNYISALRDSIRCTCWGIDPSEKMLDEARFQLPSAELRVGRAEDLPCPTGAFDLAFSVDAIHHVSDHAAYHSEAFRVLRSGGRLCTVTDSEEIIRTRRPLALYFPETIDADLKRYPQIEDLRVLALSSGFTDWAQSTVRSESILSDVDAYEARVFSCLQLISDEAFQAGLSRLREDLARGAVMKTAEYAMLWATKP